MSERKQATMTSFRVEREPDDSDVFPVYVYYTYVAVFDEFPNEIVGCRRINALIDSYESCVGSMKHKAQEIADTMVND